MWQQDLEKIILLLCFQDIGKTASHVFRMLSKELKKKYNKLAFFCSFKILRLYRSSSKGLVEV